jgi:hypothetical protein
LYGSIFFNLRSTNASLFNGLSVLVAFGFVASFTVSFALSANGLSMYRYAARPAQPEAAR